MDDRTAAPFALATGGARRRLRLPRYALTYAAAIAAAAAALWWLYGRGTPVGTAVVTRGTAAEIVYATGAVEPERWARVTPIVKGQIVERCNCEGKRVKAGDLLARLDDKEAQATLRELRAREDFDRQEFDRQSQLLARNATTSQQFQRAQSDLLRTQALIEAQIERLAYLRLTAPVDGVVLREEGEVGDIVDSATTLYRIGQPKPLWVVAQVNEEDIPRVQIGQKALLRADAFPGQALTGNVKEITPAGDPVAKTFRVRIGLPDDTPLHVGMSVEANIISREKSDVLLVPAAAIVNDAVFVVDGARARRRQVEVGLRGSSFVEIVSGLTQGEVVIAPASSAIKEGERIRPAAATSQP